MSDENQQLDEEQFGSSRVANEHDGDGDETTEEDEDRDGDETTEEDEDRDGDGTTEEDEERDDDGTTEEDEERDGYETAEDEGSCGEYNEDEREITRVEDSDNEMQELDPTDKSKADSDEADCDDSGSDDFGSGTDSALAVSNDVTIAGAVSQLCKPRTRCYFKLVGDNIDKNVKPRYMRSDNQTKSLHYFHVYAVADRVDTSQSSNQTTIIWDPQGVNLQVLLPSIDDEMIMKENFSTLISRVLVKHMKHLQSYTSIVSQHILHKYSKEMSEKSQVVSV